jgi:hypothetical protein
MLLRGAKERYIFGLCKFYCIYLLSPISEQIKEELHTKSHTTFSLSKLMLIHYLK